MAVLTIAPPYPLFTDIDGTPLDNGYVYIGQPYLDPQTNPITVYWDAALTIPAAQPLRTLNGYFTYNGTPANAYLGSDYSMRINNKNNAFIYSFPSASAPTIPGSFTVDRFSGDGIKSTFILSVVPGTTLNTQVYIDGVYQNKDTYVVSGSSLQFSEAPPLGTDNVEVVMLSTYSVGVVNADNVIYDPAGAGAVSTTVQTKLRETVSVKDFGAVGDGVTDDTVAFQNAVDAAEGQTLLAPEGSYRLGPIQLKSNSIYEFGSAIFYPSLGTGDLYLFELNAKTNVRINGGTISVASYTPVGTYSPVYSTVGTNWPNGYFYGGTAIQIQNGCSYVTVKNTRFEGCLGSVNIYDSSYVVVRNTVSYNGLAAYSTVATTDGSEIIGVQLINNQVIGGGDDSFILTTNNSTGNASLNSCIISGNYMDKTRLFASATPAAVGIRTGQYSTGIGKIYGCVISDNVLRNMITQGLYLGNMVDCTITNNIVDGFSAVTGPAFAFGASPVPGSASSNIVFTGNQCLNQDTDAVCVDINFVTNANFSNNIFNGNSGFANISGINNTYIQFIGNVFANTSGPAFRLTGTSNYNTYLGNDVSATDSPYIVTVGANNIQQNNQGIFEIQAETPANAGTVTPDMNWTKYLQIACTAGVTSFTIGAAINSINNGRPLTVSVRNQNATGAVTTTWNSSYQIGTWGSLADGFTRSITFIYNTTLLKWVEISRSSDVPN